MEIKIRTPLPSSRPDSLRQSFASGGMNVIRNFARSVSGYGSRDVGTEERKPPAPLNVNLGSDSPSKGQAGSYGERLPSRSHDVSEGEESEEDMENGKLTKSVDDVPNRKAQSDLVRSSSKCQNVGQNVNSQDNSSSKGRRNEAVQGWGMGKSVFEVSKGVAADIRGSLFQMKDLLIEKLAAVPIPAETLDNARQSMESIIREATQTAYGMTRDAMLRIRERLVEIIPSLSPHETKKIVDDVEREVLDMSETVGRGRPSENIESPVKHGSMGVTVSTASAMSSNQPSPPSVLSMNMGRIKSWALFRSRL